MSILTALVGSSETGSRFGRTVLFNYVLQALFASVGIPLKTTYFYDLGTAIGFCSTAAFSLFYPFLAGAAESAAVDGLFQDKPLAPMRVTFADTVSTLSARQIVMATLIAVWAVRFGSLHFVRILKHGEDARFDGIKRDPRTFAVAWTGQATWIILSSTPLWLVNNVPVTRQPPFGTLFDCLGVAIWMVGFGLESVADHQKSSWRARKDAKRHDERFIRTGLWSWSRHPNYVGEIILWAGLSTLAVSPLVSGFSSLSFNSRIISLLRLMAASIPPIFEYVALYYATGVPPLESAAMRKWGSDPLWQEYVSKVPVLFALPGAKI